MSERHVDPEELARLDEEVKYIDSTTHKYRRVKLEKGDEWTVRFLPMEFGPKKWFYQRIAHHWISKRPFYCHRHTAPECGGDPEFDCLLCRETERLNNSRDREISKAGFKHMANPQYILYCCAFEKQVQGEVEEFRGNERWKAFEFPMTKVTFAVFLQLYRRSLKRCEHGFLNLEEGSNIIVSLPSRDFQFERLEAKPIVGTYEKPVTPEKFQDVVDQIWSSIQLPVLAIPTDEDQEKAVEKLHEAVSYGSRGDRSGGDRDGRGDRRRSAEDDDTDDVDRPPRRSSPASSASPPPPRRSAGPPRVARRDDDEAEDDDGATTGVDESDNEEPRQPRTRRPVEDDEGDDKPLSRPAPPRVSGTTSPRPSAVASAPPPRAAKAPPPSVRAAPPPPAAKAATSSVDDDDNVTDEAKDPAPITAAAPAEADDEAPPPVTTGPSPVPPVMKDRLKRGIAAAKERA